MNTITIDDLRNYISLKTAINALRIEIESIYSETPHTAIYEIGQSTNRGTGDPTRNKVNRILGKKEKLEERIIEYEEITERIEQYIDTVKDPIIGTAIRMHFMNGVSWEKTSIKIYGYSNSDVLRKMVTRYIKKTLGNGIA